MNVLAVLVLLAASTEDDAVRVVFPKFDPATQLVDAGEKVVKVRLTPTPDGLVVAIAHDSFDRFTSSVTVALLDAGAPKLISRATVSMNTKEEGPFFATALAEPIVSGGRFLFPVRVGTMSDGMGERLRDVYFTVLNRQLVKVLDVGSRPRVPPPGGETHRVTLTALRATSRGLPDVVELRRISDSSYDRPTKESLVRKLWRFDGTKYAARPTGDPNVASTSGLDAAVDGIAETAVVGEQLGSLSLVVKGPARLAALVVLAGCEQPGLPWAENARVKKLSVKLGDEEEGRELDLVDVATEQKLALATERPVSKLTLDVLEVYPGSKGSTEACISELRIIKR